MLTTLLASPLVTHGLALLAGVGTYPFVHMLVSKVNNTVTADVAALKADVEKLKAKLP